MGAPILWGPVAGLPLVGQNSSNTQALNDSDNSVAAIFMVPKSGTIDRIRISVTAKAGTSTTVKFNIGLVTVDSSGHPTSTAYGGSSPAQPAINAISTGVTDITLTTPATAVAGDIVAVRIWPEGSVAPDGSNSITVRYSIRVSSDAGVQLPYADVWVTAWTKNANIPTLGARYSSGDVVGGFPVSASAATAFTSGTTPNERGAKLQLPVGASCIGARFILDPTSATVWTGTVKLYDGASTLLQSAAIQLGALGQAAVGYVDVWWPAQALAATTDYRLGILATSLDSAAIAQVTVPDAAGAAEIPYGDGWSATSRAGAGWTDDALSVPIMGLWLASINTALTTNLQFSVLE